MHCALCTFVQIWSAPNGHYYLQRTVTPDSMGSIAPFEHIIVFFSRAEETSEDINSYLFFMDMKGLKEWKRPYQRSRTNTFSKICRLRCLGPIRWPGDPTSRWVRGRGPRGAHWNIYTSYWQVSTPNCESSLRTWNKHFLPLVFSTQLGFIEDLSRMRTILCFIILVFSVSLMNKSGKIDLLWGWQQRHIFCLEKRRKPAKS